MKLHTLVHSLKQVDSLQTYRLLSEACSELGVQLMPLGLDELILDVSSSRQLIEPGQSFLRLAAGRDALLAESILLRDDLSTIYYDWKQPILGAPWDDTILMQKKALPIVPTVFLLAGRQKELIAKAADSLGGFPAVLKLTGLSHGQGVFLCRSADDVDKQLEQIGKDRFRTAILRKFIPEATHVRAVVVGNGCVDTIEYDVQPGDFRTNAVTTPTAKSYEASDDIKKMAVDAAQATGTKFAGVDILVGGADAYIAEVNSPFNFARNYATNGKNMALDVVKMLVDNIDKKQQKL